MEVAQIVLYVFVFLVVIYLLISAFSKTNKLTEMADGKTLQIIKAKSLKNTNNSSNFTYSMWVFVDDWNYKYGSEKVVLSRNNSPSVVLGDRPNTMKVKVKYYDSTSRITGAGAGAGATGKAAAIDTVATSAACLACSNGYTCACESCNQGVPLSAATAKATVGPGKGSVATRGGSNSNTKVHQCQIENIPIQKWANIIVSLYGSTLDVYLNGKLVRTCVLPGVPSIDNTADIQVTPAGGFSGWTSSFKYLAYASNPQEAYNLYKDGFGGSILGNAVSKYRLRFSLIKDNTDQGSFEI
jgi:hypothetical protein